MQPIADVETWIVDRSKGQDAGVGFSLTSLDVEERLILEEFQLGLLVGEIRAHRGGQPATARLERLLDTVLCSRDMRNWEICRGLMLRDGDLEKLRAGLIFEERSLSSWSLFPSVALRVALSQGQGLVTILRYQLSGETPALYVDDWEYEVLQGPYRRSIDRIRSGAINFLGEHMLVVVIDLGEDVADEQAT